MAVVLCLGLMGAAFAYFSDTETSTGNTFTAGTLDLVLSDDDETDLNGVTATWVSPSNWAPGETEAGTLKLRNSGSVDIGWIGIKPVDVIVTEGPLDFPDKIIVKGFSIADSLTGKSIGAGDPEGFANFMATWGCWGTEPPLTLAEFASGKYSFYTEPTDWLLEALKNGTTSLIMEFEFDPEADNTYQDADCSFELQVKVLQYNATLADFVHMGDACGYAPGE